MPPSIYFLPFYFFFFYSFLFPLSSLFVTFPSLFFFSFSPFFCPSFFFSYLFFNIFNVLIFLPPPLHLFFSWFFFHHFAAINIIFLIVKIIKTDFYIFLPDLPFFFPLFHHSCFPYDALFHFFTTFACSSLHIMPSSFIFFTSFSSFSLSCVLFFTWCLLLFLFFPAFFFPLFLFLVSLFLPWCLHFRLSFCCFFRDFFLPLFPYLSPYHFGNFTFFLIIFVFLSSPVTALSSSLDKISSFFFFLYYFFQFNHFFSFLILLSFYFPGLQGTAEY